ncbi:MAG: DUF2130 domain-containing protein [Verrucomicrobia bacterium]|nr:DUF2130 domain-containing protein [Verrucomicrobiota bacterium]MBU4289446.1 DUF2130 domain-containing protein [Verrucomicrobiota bacterium]MBU4428716.1 DUF2130 domain-containing protein [Verrucomicrobiota bacterium]MBU4497260.1 DUF2130 domain-containing protein [Verrucomicrobiota bacterium]MCG2679153.1 DUF2130 domain-containing protein [Kiritimatiellia bacterium]
MSEPTIICPKCKTEIKLTESLAAPLVESIRHEYEERLAKKDTDIAKRQSALLEKETALSKAKEAIDEEIANKLRQERGKIAADEAKKAKLAYANDLEQKAKELTDLQEIMKQRDVKLAEAQKAQAELIKKQRELDDAMREIDLTVEKRVQAGLSATRDQARKEAEEGLKLKVMEKEQTITSMQKQIEDLKRRAEQGSQQLQGEVQELEIEAILRSKFPLDTIDPVPKGEYGGDALQRVVDSMGRACGTILWESKRTKNWADGWLGKLRDDQRAAKAEISVLVSQVLPKDVDPFGLVDGVWVTHPRSAVPVAMVLRNTLIELASARQAVQGQQTKTEMIYHYLTGPRFKQRVEAIVEAFSSMKEDLDKEKKAITKQWAKREEQIDRVMQGTVGMYGDLQGIAGKTLQEIEGLEMKALEGHP